MRGDTGQDRSIRKPLPRHFAATQAASGATSRAQHRQGHYPRLCQRKELGEANLWKRWSTYKDVAHLVTAATLICAEVCSRFRGRLLGPTGLSPTQFVPFQMALLMPDLVLAVAMEFERYGLGSVSDARAEPALDPDSVWRIPVYINVVPLPPPFRKLSPRDIVVLNNRRAGNRGRANRTTPVSG
jgi:hypothetical protein